MQLAVQGKLTENWRAKHPNVESAELLLRKTYVEKKRLVEEKLIKKEKKLTPITIDDKLKYRIPDKWSIERLGNIGDWGAGATPLRSNPEFYGGEINWFKSGELNNSIINYESREKITKLALKKTSVRLNKPGDVLIAMYGATIGKTSLLDVEGTTNQAVCACTPFKCIKSEYLHLLLKALKQVFLNQGEGGAQPNISRVKIRNQIFLLPPLEEQKAIVAIVEELFAEVEQLEQKTQERIQLKKDYVTSALHNLSQSQDVSQTWQSIQSHFASFFNEKANIKSLRESILQLAVQGKLTKNWREQNPNTEPASELLKHILNEKSQLIKEKVFQKPRQSGDILKDEFDTPSPDTWEIAKIVDLCFVTKLAGFEYTKYINLQDTGEIPVIRAQNVKMNSLDERKLKYIDNETSELLSRCALTKPCLLMTFIGAGIGDVAIFNKKERWHLAPNVAKLEPFNNLGEKIIPEYLLFYLMSPVGQKQIFKSSKATAQPSLSMGTIRDAIVTLPPLEEQKAIVKIVDELMAYCDGLERDIEQRDSLLEDLMASCLVEMENDASADEELGMVAESGDEYKRNIK